MKKIFHYTITSISIIVLLFGFGIYLNPSIIFDFQIWVVILATFVMFGTQPKLSKSDLFNPKDKYSMLGLSLMGIIVNNVSVIHWANHAHEFSISISKWISFLMIWGGLSFRIFAIQKLNIYFSNAVTIQNNHLLYDKGVYAKIRHPSYTGAIICIIGTIIWFEAWDCFGILLVLIFLAYVHRIVQEEKILGLYFGEKYKIYRQNTGTLLPKIKLQKSDSQLFKK